MLGSQLQYQTLETPWGAQIHVLQAHPELQGRREFQQSWKNPPPSHDSPGRNDPALGAGTPQHRELLNPEIPLSGARLWWFSAAGEGNFSQLKNSLKGTPAGYIQRRQRWREAAPGFGSPGAGSWLLLRREMEGSARGRLEQPENSRQR